MIGTKTAHKYARALFAVAAESEALEAVERELHQFRDLIRDHPELSADLRGFLEHPRLPAATKKEVLARAFGESFSPLTLDFLSLMIDKKRAALILSAIGEFDKLLDEARGIQRAEVRSAVPLPDDLADALTQKLNALTGKRVILRRVIEEALIGGLVVHVGGHLIDGSIASHLETIRDRFQQARVVEVT